MRLEVRAEISLWKIVESGDLAFLIGGDLRRVIPRELQPRVSVIRQFLRKRGTLNVMLKRLHIRLNNQGLIDVDNWMIELRVVRATRASSEGG